MTTTTPYREPTITIGGVRLSDAQAGTVRVALEAFAMSLDEVLGDDGHGRAMAAGYRARIDEVRVLMFGRR